MSELMSNQSWKLVGERLKEVRERLDLTQDSVANHLRVSRPVISNIETGRRPINLGELQQFSSLYGYPMTFFLQESPDENHVVTSLFRSMKITDDDRLKLTWFHGFLQDYHDIKRLTRSVI